ncbi:uncharacterized protein V6R79_020520 [Siganus canaliculatus]
MEDRSTGLVPSWARTCEHKVDTPHQPPSPPPTLAFQALIFHMISLPPVLRLALALRAVRVTAPFSAGKIFTETCFITMDLNVSPILCILENFIFENIIMLNLFFRWTQLQCHSFLNVQPNSSGIATHTEDLIKES